MTITAGVVAQSAANKAQSSAEGGATGMSSRHPSTLRFGFTALRPR